MKTKIILKYLQIKGWFKEVSFKFIMIMMMVVMMMTIMVMMMMVDYDGLGEVIINKLTVTYNLSNLLCSWSIAIRSVNCLTK